MNEFKTVFLSTKNPQTNYSQNILEDFKKLLKINKFNYKSDKSNAIF